MRPRWRATIGNDAWRTSDRVAASYALKHGPATSGIRPFCSTRLLRPGNADRSTREVVMLTRSHIALGMQEFMNIQSKVAPDQCELPRLSGQAAAAQRAGDLGKRQEIIM